MLVPAVKATGQRRATAAATWRSSPAAIAITAVSVRAVPPAIGSALANAPSVGLLQPTAAPLALHRYQTVRASPAGRGSIQPPHGYSRENAANAPSAPPVCRLPAGRKTASPTVAPVHSGHYQRRGHANRKSRRHAPQYANRQETPAAARRRHQAAKDPAAAASSASVGVSSSCSSSSPTKIGPV